jgi:hypothetical protein
MGTGVGVGVGVGVEVGRGVFVGVGTGVGVEVLHAAKIRSARHKINTVFSMMKSPVVVRRLYHRRQMAQWTSLEGGSTF